jgi:hypothetical protein
MVVHALASIGLMKRCCELLLVPGAAIVVRQYLSLNFEHKGQFSVEI